MESIDSILLTTPKVLKVNSSLQELANYYLPYKTGFEVECSQASDFNLDSFKNIPNLIECKIDSYEQRFQIPSGLKGLICLYDISIQLKLNSELNPLSGVHYHVDFTDNYDLITDEVITKYKEEILKELDTWDYKGKYNRRDVSRRRCWVRVHGHCKTLEYRIGEMTFDYDLLVKRIIHCNSITRDLKEKLIWGETLNHNPSLLYQENIRKVLNNRTEQI